MGPVPFLPATHHQYKAKVQALAILADEPNLQTLISHEGMVWECFLLQFPQQAAAWFPRKHAKNTIGAGLRKVEAAAPRKWSQIFWKTIQLEDVYLFIYFNIF